MHTPLAFGSHGPLVRDLQLRLKAAGFDPGDIDGVFGKLTRGALERFQDNFDKLEVTGTLTPETDAALDQVLAVREKLSPDHAPGAALDPATVCCTATRSEFLKLVELLTTFVTYGPGRGLYVGDHFVVTYGPGALGLKTWKCKTGKTRPSFHCTSLANFILGWLLRYNAEFTHAGNIPSVFTLLESSRDLHKQSGGSAFRGYGPYAKEIVSDGSTTARWHMAKVIDMKEMYARRAELPSFMVAGQSDKYSSGWNLWHHVVIFFVDHHDPAGPQLYRLAADGRYDKLTGYSQSPVRFDKVTDSNLSAWSTAVYRPYGITDPLDTAGPRAKVTIEP